MRTYIHAVWAHMYSGESVLMRMYVPPMATDDCVCILNVAISTSLIVLSPLPPFLPPSRLYIFSHFSSSSLTLSPTFSHFLFLLPFPPLPCTFLLSPLPLSPFPLPLPTPPLSSPPSLPLSSTEHPQDKILMSSTPGGGGLDMKVTNDGATILKSIGIDNPAAKILVGTYVGGVVVKMWVWL